MAPESNAFSIATSRKFLQPNPDTLSWPFRPTLASWLVAPAQAGPGKFAPSRPPPSLGISRPPKKSTRREDVECVKCFPTAASGIPGMAILASRRALGPKMIIIAARNAMLNSVRICTELEGTTFPAQTKPDFWLGNLALEFHRICAARAQCLGFLKVGRADRRDRTKCCELPG